ncbi:MAG: AAA family ATPase [Chloroflexota bacterium]|nr:AAA family ATPase [Chloroflexota bacterium]
MRLSRIELPGFGCLSGFSAELGPGLNLFYGDNETGKSTLQHAICAMLYGFYENDRARPDETARHDRFRPWAGGVYRGVLAYELDDGRTFEVRRDFSTPDVITQLLDPALGADVSPQFGRGRHGNIPFARRHLGMSRGVFESSAFISQGEIFDLAKKASPSQIGDAIAALADSARRDVSAAKAIERLEAAEKKIGRDQARTAELPKAREALTAKTGELRSADEARAAVAEKSRRLEDLQKQGRGLAEQALRAEYLCSRAEAARLREQLRKLDEAESLTVRAGRRRDELREFAPISPVTRDEVLALRGQRDRVADSLGRLRKQREALPQVIEDERLQYEALRSSVGGFADEQVRVLEAAAYRTDRAEEGSGEREGQTSSGVARVFAAIVRVVAATARRLVAFVLRRRAPLVAEPEALPAEPAVSQAEAIALLEKHRRYFSLRPVIEEVARVESQIDAEEASLGAIDVRLRSLLAGAGIAPAALGDALVAFEDAWQKREEYLGADAEAEEASRRRGLLLNGRSRQEMATMLVDLDDAVRRMISERPQLKGCETSQAPEQLSRALAKARDEQHRCELEMTRLDQDVTQTLERFRPRAEIEEDVAYWAKEVARLERGRAALAIALGSIQQAMTDVYRDFAPAVNAFLSEGLEAATDGRYQRAHVDPSTLRISLLVPETGQVMTDPPVSHGTRALLYVLMRIGLAQHMSAIGEPVPLVLDDPFVDLDSRRLRRILDFLLELSTRMQVLLFTKDREALEWFEQRANGRAHRIHPLSGVLAASIL